MRTKLQHVLHVFEVKASKQGKQRYLKEQNGSWYTEDLRQVGVRQDAQGKQEFKRVGDGTYSHVERAPLCHFEAVEEEI